MSECGGLTDDQWKKINLSGVFEVQCEAQEKFLEAVADFVAEELVKAITEYKATFGRLPGSLRTKRLSKKMVDRIYRWKIGK